MVCTRNDRVNSSVLYARHTATSTGNKETGRAQKDDGQARTNVYHLP